MHRSSKVAVVAAVAVIASSVLIPTVSASATQAVRPVSTRAQAGRGHRVAGHRHNSRGRYTATFTDAAGHPLAGVVVSAESSTAETEASTGTATSGRNGRVVLSLPAGHYLIDADATRARGGSSDATGYVGSDRFITIRSGRTHSAGVVTLAAGGAVQVHVIDAKGRPVAGVHPQVTPIVPYVQPDQDGGFGFLYFDESATAGPRTDAGGNVTITGVPGSIAFQVCVNPNGDLFDGSDASFLSTCTGASTLATPGRTVSSATITVHRRTGATLVGTVRDHAGLGFAQSQVDVMRGDDFVGTAQTTSRGRFRVGGLRPGTYRACAENGPFLQRGRTGYQPGCAADPVTITGGTATASTKITLRVGAAASGTITGPHQVPVDGALVDVQRSHGGAIFTQTDSRGHFVIKGLPAGHNAVCAHTDTVPASRALPYGVRSDCKHTRVHFTARVAHVTAGLHVHLPIGGAVSGTVVDRRGRPVPKADVEADLSGEGMFEGGAATATADKHGQFTVSGLRSGRYRFCADVLPGFVTEVVTGDGVQACRHKYVTVRVGHLVRHIRIVLPTTSAVRVTAVDQHGRGVAGVDATVIVACHSRDCDPGTTLLPRRRTSVASTGTTNSRGTALLDGLLPGHYTVCLFAFYGTTRAGAPSTGYADRCSGPTLAVDVRAGHTVSKRLVLHPGGAVSGRVTDANGDPLAGVLVHVAGSAADDLPQSETEFPDELGDEGGGPTALPGYYSTTAANGTYTVRSVIPGDRLVCVDPTAATGGASTGGYLPQCVGGAVGSTTKGDPVRVSGATTTGGVDLALTAGAAITGHASSKVPSSDTAVVLFRAGKLIAQDDVTGAGAFRFASLVPDTYTVCAVSFGRHDVRGRCYDDVAWNPGKIESPPPGATPVQVLAGATRSGIDIVVPR